MSVEQFRSEINKRERFQFGDNWKGFLGKISDDRIRISQEALIEMLGHENLKDSSFLDIGSGSGLSSLAAKHCGSRVTSFDFDEDSVSCTRDLKAQFFPEDGGWDVLQGSVLDNQFLKSLGEFDIVYSWGVLHHTGQMWIGIDNSMSLVKKGGLYYIAIYNDQGAKSHCWWLVKYLYIKLPTFLQKPFAYSLGFLAKLFVLLKYTIKLKPMVILGPMLDYKQKRGMSMLSDMVDWYGGFPFEFATYDYLVEYIENRGFELVKGKEPISTGCSQIVFKRVD